MSSPSISVMNCGRALSRGLALAPVVLGRPIARERLNRRELHALRRIGDRFPFGPPGRVDAPAQFGQFRLRHIRPETDESPLTATTSASFVITASFAVSSRLLADNAVAPRHAALAALSLSRNPLADVGRTVPEFDAIRFGQRQERHGITVDQLDLREFEGDDIAVRRARCERPPGLPLQSDRRCAARGPRSVGSRSILQVMLAPPVAQWPSKASHTPLATHWQRREIQSERDWTNLGMW